MARSRLGYDEPSTIDGYLDLERVASGATYSHREIVIPGGTATGQLAQFASQPVAATALGLIARLGGSSGVNIGNVKPAANTSWHIEGNTTATLTTGSTGRVELSSGGLGGSTAAPVFVNVAQNLSQVYQGTTALVPQYAGVTVTVSGVIDVVASGAGAIYLLSAQFSANASCTIQWMDGSATALGGAQAVGANGGYVLPHNPHGWLHTASGQKLGLSVHGSTAGIGGTLTFVRPAS